MDRKRKERIEESRRKMEERLHREHIDAIKITLAHYGDDKMMRVHNWFFDHAMRIKDEEWRDLRRDVMRCLKDPTATGRSG